MQKSARILGQELGLTAQEMHVLLKKEGFLDGEIGKYFVTDKGKPFAHEQDFHSGPGGYSWYNRDWSTRTWDDAVLEDLKVTDQMKWDARDAAASIRRATRAQRETGYQPIPDTLEQSSSRQNGDGNGSLPPAGVVLLVVAGAIMVAAASWWVFTQVKRSRERKHRQTRPPQGSSS